MCWPGNIRPALLAKKVATSVKCAPDRWCAASTRSFSRRHCAKCTGRSKASLAITWCRFSTATELSAETLQLHFPEAAQGAAKWKRQITICVELFERHLRLDVQGHSAVVALIHQRDEPPNRIIQRGKLRQLPIAGFHQLCGIFSTTGDTPFALLAAQPRYIAQQDRSEERRVGKSREMVSV